MRPVAGATVSPPSTPQPATPRLSPTHTPPVAPLSPRPVPAPDGPAPVYEDRLDVKEAVAGTLKICHVSTNGHSSLKVAQL